MSRAPGKIAALVIGIGIAAAACATSETQPHDELRELGEELGELKESGALPDIDSGDIEFVEEHSGAPDFSDYATGETMTVTHAMGTTVIPRNPRVVMSTGFAWQYLGHLATTTGDSAAETSFLPLPLPDDDLSYGEEFPWEQARTIFKPDLILANSITDPALYERLSDIAPTVVGTDASGQVDTGKAIDFYRNLYDDPAAREALWNAKTTYRLAVKKAAGAFPELHGKTFTYIRPSHEGDRHVVHTATDDPTNRYLTELGMILNPAIATDEGSADIAVYHPGSDVRDLRSDVIFWAGDCPEACAPDVTEQAGQFIVLDESDALMLNNPPFQEYQLRAMGMAALSDSVLATVG